jgi:tRNA (cmo5U34)-methyltransferase
VMTDIPIRAADAFDRYAGTYDAARRRLVPPFDDFYGTAVEALALGGRPPRRVLDLGAGTGLLAAFVRAAHPDAELTLLDGSARMLAQAREMLGADRTTFVERDMNDPLPPGPWDAVVSALAIHHLTDDEKRSLFTRVQAGLAPGGVFINAEQVIGPSPQVTEFYEHWHEARARRAGTDDAEWAGALERMAHDRCATVEDQLGWLRAAGFTEADCLFKERGFAVLVALSACRTAGRQPAGRCRARPRSR